LRKASENPYELAGAHRFEIARRKAQEMVEHRAPDVRDDPLAGAEHEKKPRIGRKGKQHRETEDRNERAVEHGRAGRSEARVDHIAQSLAEREDARGRHQQRDYGRRDAQAIRDEEPGKADELGEVPAARPVGQAIVED